jgi:hypothetical protein
VPRECLGVADAKLAGCIYVRAVLDQNPFTCYSIWGIDQRKACISDASSPAMKKKVAGMPQAERDAIFSPKAQNDLAIPRTPQEQEPLNGTAAGQGGQSPNATGEENATRSADEQAYVDAVAANDVQLCERIADPTTLQSCISEVARQKKDLGICETLVEQANREICRMYAQGDA